MLTPLSEACREPHGAKSASLGRLLAEGLPVPDGFVVTARPGQPADGGDPGPRRPAIGRALERLGNPVVAVRSSAAGEDSAHSSAAGQYESVIGVRGTDAVCQAIARCRDSARTERVESYWARTGTSDPGGMAVLVQRLIAADSSGVMFTPQRAGEPTRIEASWGLGLSVVGGGATPDGYDVAPDGTVRRAIGSKASRIDADPERGGVTTRWVPDHASASIVLGDDMIAALVEAGARIAAILGGPQDVEWAIAGERLWILQARPITAPLPARRAPHPARPTGVMTGSPGSGGSVTGTARVVRGPADFSRVRPGDIVICPYTDPAWTPLFAIAAGVVTETGGTLSHAAIVAREYGLPAVLGVAGALGRVANGERITLDGTAGTITFETPPPRIGDQPT